MPTSTSVAELKRRIAAKEKSTAALSIVITKAPTGTAKSKGKPKLPKAMTRLAPKPAAAASPKV